jgi:hypothetical protein
LGASNWHIPSSLLSTADRNHLSDIGLGDREEEVLEDSGSNPSEPVDFPAGAGGIQSMLFDVRAWLETSREAAREAGEQQMRIRAEAQQQAYVERMQGFLESGDPILMAEASAWAEINPGVLNEERLVVLALRDAVQAFWLGLQALLPQMQRMFWGGSAGCWRFALDEGVKRDE